MPDVTLGGDDTFSTTGTFNDTNYDVASTSTVAVGDAAVITVPAGPFSVSAAATVVGCETRPLYLLTPTTLTFVWPDYLLSNEGSGADFVTVVVNDDLGTPASGSVAAAISGGKLVVDTGSVVGADTDYSASMVVELPLGFSDRLTVLSADFYRPAAMSPSYSTYRGSDSSLVAAGLDGTPLYLYANVDTDYSGSGDLYIVCDGSTVYAMLYFGYTGDDTTTFATKTWAVPVPGTGIPDSVRVEVVSGGLHITVNTVTEVINLPVTEGGTVSPQVVGFMGPVEFCATAACAAGPDTTWVQWIQVANMRGDITAVPP